MPRHPARGGTRWYRTTHLVKQRVLAGEPCCHCGQPINLELRNPHPRSFTVEHIIPLCEGGTDDPTNTAPAHRYENLRAEEARRRRRRQQRAVSKTSRDW